MALRENVQNILSNLFDNYKNNPDGLVQISTCVNGDLHLAEQYGQFLVTQGYVKNQSYTNGFMCQISDLGILQVEPDYFADQSDIVISVFGLNGGQGSVIEALDLEQKFYAIARDITEWMKDMGYLENILYTAGDITASLSLVGRDYYDQNKAESI